VTVPTIFPSTVTSMMGPTLLQIVPFARTTMLSDAGKVSFLEAVDALHSSTAEPPDAAASEIFPPFEA
jgi:hypothetical protein